MTDTAVLRSQSIEAHRAGKTAQAMAGYAQYLAMVPADAGVWSNLGVLHRISGQHFQALRAHRRAIAIKPDDQGFLNNIANILSDVGQYDESLVIRRNILRTQPADANQLAMVGRCLRGKGDYSAAIDHLKTASAAHPADSELQLQLSFALLADGQYTDGFAAYEARWQGKELKQRDLDFPQWRGEPLNGKTITVLPEQGFGDAILFMRFLSVLKERGATVRVATEKPLLRLFDGLPDTDEVFPVTSDRLKSDYWVNMMDLAQPYFETQSDIPAPTRLTIPNDAIERAKARVAPFLDTVKVGVVWTGSETYKGNAFRSFHHSDYMPLTDIDGVQLFSLYKGPALREYVEDGTSAFIIDGASSDRDFSDCAALMQEMDIVITSDTATAHVAGSLGVNVWTILHWDPFWLWGHAGDETPWYPSMRLFRQHKPMDWSGVMADVERALKDDLKGRR